MNIKNNFTWKKYHRWIGLVMSVFMLVFCVSGIILNHRSLFRSIEVGRWWMPSSYHIDNFNNGVIKGTQPVDNGMVIAYGATGAWLTDSLCRQWHDYNAGLPQGADNRNVRNIVRAKDGCLWMATQYDLYRYDGKQWQRMVLPGNDERIADVALTKDSTQLVVLSRSKVYLISNVNDIQSLTLKSPKGYAPQTTLFKTIWKLHSGEYFGMPGILVVDAIAVVLIVLSLTGIVLFILPYDIRRMKRKGNKEAMKKQGKRMVWNQKWHNKFGYATIILTLWIAITGMCLRPPLMIPFVMMKTSQPVDDNNVWKDKLRAIRWNPAEGCWLISTSEGFLKVDETFKNVPVMIAKDKAPAISPMGVTVFESVGDEWFIGSFSGLYRWNAKTGRVADAFTGKAAEMKSMRPVSNAAISGYSNHLLGGKPIVFDYNKGAQELVGHNVKKASIPMPKMLSNAKMSLWNVALELHVGRCYTPFLGPISDLFVFLSGLLISLVLLSGFIILRRQKKKKSKLSKL